MFPVALQAPKGSNARIDCLLVEFKLDNAVAFEVIVTQDIVSKVCSKQTLYILSAATVWYGSVQQFKCCIVPLYVCWHSIDTRYGKKETNISPLQQQVTHTL